MEIINKCKKKIKIAGVKYFLLDLIYHIFPIFSINNTRFRSLFFQKKVVSKLKKYLSLQKAADNTEKIPSNYIWIFWNQGKEKMPEIVQKCYTSVQKYCDKKEIILLDESNVNSYIEIPDYIEEKYKAGIIPIAQYSDILRILLLAKHGGLWIDATIWLSNEIPDFIWDSDFFMFKSSMLEASIIQCSSWCIYSKYPNNPMIIAIRDSFLSYWKTNQKLIHPFVFHLLIASLIENCDWFRSQWNNIPYVCNMNPHILYFNFSAEYSREKMEQIISQSSIHKLSWKVDKNDYNQDSIFSHWLNRGYEEE